MEKELITIAVAVYNAENYIAKTIESIINQDYQNLEILLINDGSKDSSGKICDEYALKDNRIKVIHKQNGGLCAARNTVLDNMHGNYLMFVDNDDWIEPNIVSFLYQKIVENDLDMASCTSIDYFEGTSKSNKVQRGPDKIFDSKEGIKDFYFDRQFTFDAIQCKLYKKEVFNNIRFKEGRATDDTLTTPRIIDACNKIGYYDVGLYNYLVRENSMCRTTYNAHTIDKVLAYTDNIDLIKEKYPESLKLLEHNIYGSAATNYLKLKVLHKEKEFVNDMIFYKKLLKEYKPVISSKRLFVSIFYYLYKAPFIIDIICNLFNKQIQKAIGA